MDGLEIFLSGLRVQRAAFTRFEGYAPWGLDLDAYPHTKFGIVTEGSCFIDIKNDTSPVNLVRGSCYLLPRGNAFRIRHAVDGSTDKFEEVIKSHSLGSLLRYGSDGERTSVIGGQFVFTNDRYPLILDLLPPLICFNVNDEELDELQSTLKLLEKEIINPAPGTATILDSLADIFFIQTLRAYLLRSKTRNLGWAGILSDDRLGQALRLIHAESSKSWTIESLASQIGMSRASFSSHFKNKLGISPIAYLTRHRMNLAQDLLRRSESIGIAQVASQVGYDSDAAFNKAFKREVGISPALWRSKGIVNSQSEKKHI